MKKGSYECVKSWEQKWHVYIGILKEEAGSVNSILRHAILTSSLWKILKSLVKTNAVSPSR